MVCVSLECVEITIIYLYIHGFFKATSFLCIGNVIRVALNYQDFRKMGMLFKYLPFEYYILCICLLNLSGVPFTIGFYSKHLLFAGFHSLSI
jgi:NADH-quinone oxidoreductase subunit L